MGTIYYAICEEDKTYKDLHKLRRGIHPEDILVDSESDEIDLEKVDVSEDSFLTIAKEHYKGKTLKLADDGNGNRFYTSGDYINLKKYTEIEPCLPFDVKLYEQSRKK